MSDIITVTGEPLDLPMTEEQLRFYYGEPINTPPYFIPHTEHFNIEPKGRRFGATHGASHFCIEKMAEGKKGLWVDTVQGNLDRYVSRFFKPALKQIQPKYWQYKSSQKLLTLCDGLLDLRSAEKPENIEGFGYDFIIINETGIVLKGHKGRYLWYNAILPMTLDYKAFVYLIGTPKGRKAKKDEKGEKYSLYFELASKGRCLPNSDCPLETSPKHPDWRTIQVSSYDNPLLNPQDIKELEEEVPFAVRKQEIYGEFVDKGDEEVFKTEWFHVAYELPDKHLWRRLAISMDTAFKKGAENDDSAACVCLETTVGYFFLDCWAAKLEFPELVNRTAEYIVKWESANYILIEDKASGQSLLQMFKQNIDFPVVGINPDTDKYSRAVAISPLWKTGKCFLLFGAWNKMFIDQMTDFNELMDTPDDIVDTVSQVLNYFSSSRAPKAPVVTRRIPRRSKTLKGY